VPRTDRVACDAGPIIALINRRDQFHDSCLSAAELLPFPMFTVWPVIVEAYYVIASRGGPANRVLHWIAAGHLRLIDIRATDVRRVQQLLKKYVDLPMDLGDAALVAACERAKITRIFTVDRKDFLIYRPTHVAQFEVIP
jgi:predicted nucleic acid-binding protein